MEMTKHTVQKVSDEVRPYSKEEYRRKSKLEGARTAFTTPVFEQTVPAEDTELALSCRLRKNFTQEVLGLVKEVERWTQKEQRACVWVSDTLPVDLNLKMTMKHPFPEYPTVQILFLGEDRHFFVLTVCDTRRKSVRENTAIEEKLRDYSVRMARLMTSALYNFCHCDFILLPCTLLLLPEEHFMEALGEELKNQVAGVRRFYGGPEKVTADMYHQLKSAVSAVAGATYFPCFLEHPNKKQVWLLLLDSKWGNLLSLVIEAIIHKDADSCVTYTPHTAFKLQAAVLEAAIRLGYAYRVVVLTIDRKISPSIERFLAEAEAEDQPKPNLRVFSPTDTMPEADYVINIEQCHIYFRCDVFRFILLGKTGNGKSATGNTILCKEVFKSELSFGLVTTECQTKANTDRDIKVEVTDTPGLFDVGNQTKSCLEEICNTVSRIEAGLDAVFYVVQLNVYTEEEYRVYLNAKAVLGDCVVDHMIVIFTFGDQLQSNSMDKTLEDAPTQLKCVLADCNNRFVVFNNEAENKRTQVEELIKLVKAMKHLNRSTRYTPPKFSPEDRETRLCNAEAMLHQAYAGPSQATRMDQMLSR